jgi:hypothetical protein
MYIYMATPSSLVWVQPQLDSINWTTSKYKYYVTERDPNDTLSMVAGTAMHLPLTRLAPGKQATYKVALVVPVEFQSMLPLKLSYQVAFETGPSGSPKTVTYDDFTFVKGYADAVTRLKRC